MIKVNQSPRQRGKYGNAKTGTFTPLHPEKYTGTAKPIYKSTLELKFMRYLDRNPKIRCWNYEPMHIFYLDKSSNPPEKRKYYIDFVFQDLSGQKYWVEIKPSSETHAPRDKNDKRAMMLWMKNSSKWNAAKILAESKGCKFKVITDKEL